MSTLDFLLADPRLTVRRSAAPDPDGRCVVYWMQRAQRARDNAALNAAIEAGNCLGKPVVVFFQLVPHSHHANLRNYQFLIEGLKDIATDLKKRRVGWIIRRYPQHGLVRFCSEVRPCLVIGDENPMKEAELVKDKIARKIALPFWTYCAVQASCQRALCGADDPPEDSCFIAAILETGGKPDGEVYLAHARAAFVIGR